MSDSIEAIVAGAVSEATGTDVDLSDPNDGVVEEGGGTDAAVEGAEGAPAAVSAPAATDTGVVAAEPPVAPPAAVQQPTDEFWKEHGLQEPKAGQRENKLPYSRVKQIVSNAEIKLAKVIFGDAVPTDKPIAESIKAHVARIPAMEQEVTAYKERVASYDQAGSIMQNDPERFLSMLVNVNPRYGELLSGKLAPTQAVVPVPEKRPEPDVEFAEGKWTYSPEGLQKLVRWENAQAEKAITGKLKPVLDRYEADQRVQQLLPKLQQRLDYARKNWEYFTPANEPKILQVLQTNPQVGLEEAYIYVAAQEMKAERASLKADREKMRAELLKEINAAPKATSVAGGTAVPRSTPTTQPGASTEDVIKAALAAAGA